jgi:glycine cleavage system H protein
MSRYFSEEHEWVERQGDLAVVGITDHAQSQLGEVVYAELPQTGRRVKKGDPVAVVESVKAASDVYTPLTGEIVEANTPITSDPARINTEAESGAWLFKVRVEDEAEFAGLMDEATYRKFIGA